MEKFTKTINGIEFSFQVFSERMDEVCRVSVDGQDFKMTVSETGNWQILQQVPSWIKKMEKELSSVIEKTFCK